MHTIGAFQAFHSKIFLRPLDSSKIPVGKANGLGYCYLDRKISRYVRRDGVLETNYYEEGTKDIIFMQVDQHTRSQKHLIILDTIKQNDHCGISLILRCTEKHDEK